MKGELFHEADQLSETLTWRIEMVVLKIKLTAGHYVPQLAQALYQYNKGQTNVSIPLKGFMVRPLYPAGPPLFPRDSPPLYVQ